MADGHKKETYLREERDRALFEAYNRAVATMDFESQCEAIDYARTHEAPRFYVDADFLHIVIGRIRRGVDIGVDGELSRQKFLDMYELVIQERTKPENAFLSIMDLCCMVVNMPAPSFYIGYSSARHIISKQRKLKWEEVQRRARR